MSRPSPCRFLVVLAATALMLVGCSTSKPLSQQPASLATMEQSVATDPKVPTPDQPSPEEPNPTDRSEQSIQESERNRSSCFCLQPGSTTTKVIKEQVPAKTRAKTGVKKGAKTFAKTPMVTVTKIIRTTGRCQPQSLIYARCRTGIATCKLGDTSPVQWFHCAKKNNATSFLPAAGSVIVLDVNSHRSMPTGHPAYVEEVRENGDGTWTLRISHTNYDRKCHLDQDATVIFDPKRMTASFMSGPWATWAKDLKALGFILR